MPEISLVLQNALAAGVLREIKVRITGARLVGKVVPKGKDEKGFTEEQVRMAKARFAPHPFSPPSSRFAFIAAYA